jgi:hypothetical protein
MKKYRDEIALVCHEMIKDGHALGLISDGEMREFEENAFVSVPGTAEEKIAKPADSDRIPAR